MPLASAVSLLAGTSAVEALAASRTNLRQALELKALPPATSSFGRGIIDDSTFISSIATPKKRQASLSSVLSLLVLVCLPCGLSQSKLQSPFSRALPPVASVPGCSGRARSNLLWLSRD
jgi:hypothetical protein